MDSPAPDVLQKASGPLSSSLGVGAAQTGLNLDSAFHTSPRGVSEDRVLEDSTAEAIVLTNPPLSTPIKVGDLIYVIGRPRWERRQGTANCKVTVDHDVDGGEAERAQQQATATDTAQAQGGAPAPDEETTMRRGPFFTTSANMSAPAVGLNRLAPVVNVNVRSDGNAEESQGRRGSERRGGGERDALYM